jgi:2-amino-4-hydroxy-6-hydroxymethyldihydropteridine diphosphokinase
MNRVYLALGSNLAPRLTHLSRAIHALNDIGKIEKIGGVYESAPIDGSLQPRFLNSAVLLQTPLSAAALLSAVKNIETMIGRMARYVWGPREIDIDIIFYNDHNVKSNGLQIPHYAYAQRRFVLQPLCDLAPDFKPPDRQESLSELLAACPDKNLLTQILISWKDYGIKF